MNPSIKKSKTPVPAAKKPAKKNPAAEAFWNKPAEQVDPTPTVQDAAPVTEAPAAEPEVVTTASKKAAKKKAKAAKPEGDQKPTPPPAEDGLCVFALRLTLAERTKLHETAGPAKASRFARAILNAAANRDVDRLREIVEATRATQ